MFANLKTPSKEHKYLFEDSLKKDKKNTLCNIQSNRGTPEPNQQLTRVSDLIDSIIATQFS